jgi:hypothetical protein
MTAALAKRVERLEAVAATAEGTTPADELLAKLAPVKYDLCRLIETIWPGARLRRWQRELCDELSAAMEENALLAMHEPIRRAVSSAHSIGKTALSAMLTIALLVSHRDTRIIVLANSESQLINRSFAEIAKWFRAAPMLHDYFTLTATTLASSDPKHSKTWSAVATAWTEHRIESVQGLHVGKGGRAVVICDESSAHPPMLWQALSGVLLDQEAEIIWLALGNPLRSSGPFYDALMAPASPWKPRFISAFDVEELNRSTLDRLLVEYGGMESDLARTRLLGLPPRAGDLAFFNRAEVEEAMRRPVVEAFGYPMVIGVDVARRGGDASVLTFRRHLDARSFPPVKLHGLDLMALAGRVAAEANKMRALGLRVVIMADGTGLGAGLVDRLRQLGYDVVDVQFAAKAGDPVMYANLRAAMHGEIRDWLRKGGALPVDAKLLEQMAAIEYGHTPTGQILLERKDDLRERLGYSPDELDSLACTFAAPVNVDGDDGRGADLRRKREAYERGEMVESENDYWPADVVREVR